MFGFWEFSILASLFWVWLIPYIWIAVCLMVIANKPGTPDGWLAFIPLLNIYLFQLTPQSNWFVSHLFSS